MVNIYIVYKPLIIIVRNLKMDVSTAFVAEETKEQKRLRLKRLLRDKVNRNNNNNNIKQTLLKDPQTALLSLGVEDKLLLDNAKNIVNSAKNIATKKNVSLPASTITSAEPTSTSSQTKTMWGEEDTDDDEGLPELPPGFKREPSKSENSDDDEELPENI